MPPCGMQGKNPAAVTDHRSCQPGRSGRTEDHHTQLPRPSLRTGQAALPVSDLSERSDHQQKPLAAQSFKTSVAPALV